MTLITSLTEYLDWVSKIGQKQPRRKVLFRGHSDKKYKALPSVFREEKWATCEGEMIKMLLATHPTDFEKETTTLERLVRAQHYGLPTRLLDTTRNPLVALYFACQPNKSNSREHTGEVIAFSPTPARQKYFDSDTVSLLANMSLLSENERNEIKKRIAETYDESKDEEEETRFDNKWIELFNDHPCVMPLKALVMNERPGFQNRINPRDLSNVFAVVPRRLNQRMVAQDGEFLIFGVYFDPKEHFFAEDIEIKEVHISGSKKEKILSELRSIAITKETLFPEIQESARWVKDAAPIQV